MVGRDSRQRLLNPDGSFNARRRGLGIRGPWSLYHRMLTISWPRFLATIVGTYTVANAVFGAVFLLLGPDALTGPAAETMGGAYARAFFFSVQTLATIGYGNISPAGLTSNLVVAVEALVGVLLYALVAGLVFARVARPTANVIFSRVAVIAPYRDITGFMFRLVNGRRNELMNVAARLYLSRWSSDGSGSREFVELELERTEVVFLPLSWTVVHPIDESSPLAGVDEAALTASDAEFYVLVTAVDETFAQTVHARTSYKPSQMHFGLRFRQMLFPDPDGVMTVDVRLLGEVEQRA